MKVYNEVRRRPRVQTVNLDPEVTVQSDGPGSEIRAILRKYAAVGIVDHLKEVDLVFRDVTEFSDFRDVMLQAKDSERVFMQLPAPVREVFGNDVGTWLDVAHDDEKMEALRPKFEALGVVKPAAPVAAPAVPAPIPVP